MDAFLPGKLSKAIEEREKRANLVDEVNDLLTDAVARLKKRGISHPYVKNFVVARCNPLSRARKKLPDFDTTLSKLQESLKKFDVSSIRQEDIARASVGGHAE